MSVRCSVANGRRAAGGCSAARRARDAAAMAVATAEDGCGEGMEAPDTPTAAGAHTCAMAADRRDDGGCADSEQQRRWRRRRSQRRAGEGGREEWHRQRSRKYEVALHCTALALLVGAAGCCSNGR